MTDKTVVIGVGAQKGGTSWLHYFLKNHPQCAMSPVKELHYFDCLEMKRQSFMANNLQEMKKRLFGDAERAAENVAPITVEEARNRFEVWAGLMAHDTVDTAAYLNYLLLGSDGAKVVGEVTPAYAMLSADSFRAMRSVAPNTKLIFVMRDPVSRLWSNLRMRASKRNQTETDILDHTRKDFAAVLNGRIAGIARRSDYARTLKVMDAAVPAEDVHYEFFEGLFDDGAARICAFLGIDAMEAPADTNVNEGVRVALPGDLGRDMLVWLKPQYDCVREKFGQLPAKWTQSLEEYA